MGGAVTHDGPGDYVSTVVRARAGVLAEVELERFNLQQGVLGENQKDRRRKKKRFGYKTRGKQEEEVDRRCFGNEIRR